MNVNTHDTTIEPHIWTARGLVPSSEVTLLPAAFEFHPSKEACEQILCIVRHVFNDDGSEATRSAYIYLAGVQAQGEAADIT
jgi:hypothetical protein